MQTLFPRIAVLIVNYRTPRMTLDCLASVAAERNRLGDLQTVLVDSASGDGSADVIESEAQARGWDGWVHVVRLNANRGFSAGNNAALAAARRLGNFDAFLLLNSDTVVHPGAIAALGEAFTHQKDVGLIGPRLAWPDGQTQISCFRNVSPATELITAANSSPVSRLFRRREIAIRDPSTLDPSTTGEIEWISFASVLIRSETIESVGWMDEAFFMYFEDVDYCRRARRAGWRIAYVPSAHVVHLRGGRTPETFEAEERNRRPEYYYRSRARYMAKYYGRTGPVQANACWLLGRGVSLAREIFGRKTPHTAACEAADIWKGALCGFSQDIPPARLHSETTSERGAARMHGDLRPYPPVEK